jgi:transcriptional regulator with XRE-family HTH domain
MLNFLNICGIIKWQKFLFFPVLFYDLFVFSPYTFIIVQLLEHFKGKTGVSRCSCTQTKTGDVIRVFYDIFVALCAQRGVKPSRVAEECGISRSNVASWKAKGYTPRGEALQVIADYFGVPVDQLLGKAPQEGSPASGREPTEEEIKVALFGGGGEVTDAMWEEAKNFIAFIKERERKKKEGS